MVLFTVLGMSQISFFLYEYPNGTALFVKKSFFLHCCVISVMGPYLIMLCIQRDMARTLAPIFHYRGEDMNVYFKDIILSGLRSFAEKYRSGERPSAMELSEESPSSGENGLSSEK